MKAYYRQIRYHDESSLKILNRAKALADKINDKNTSDWINHNRMVRVARRLWAFEWLYRGQAEPNHPLLHNFHPSTSYFP